MATVSELMEVARRKIDEHKAEVSALGAIYKFVLEGEGGGTFLLNLKEHPSVSEGDGDADCTIRMAVKDFVELVQSRGDARSYFFMGKIGVDGSFGLAIKLRKLIDMFR
jgi:putative sterol carrier protein